MIKLFGHLYAPDDRGLNLVTVEGDRIVAIEPASVPTHDALGNASTRILPGLLDIQVNGAFGDDFADPKANMDRIARGMTRFGVTGYCPTIVTSFAPAYAPALANLDRKQAPGEAEMLGVHIEGPFISPKHKGTHNPDALRNPDVKEGAAWLESGTKIAYVTLAPELPGSAEFISFMVKNGVRVSMGHTDATWEDAAAGAAAGATMATHLFNAMRPLKHRDPGIPAYMLTSHLPAGFIGDGNHLAFETIRLITRIKAPDELYLVTDALAGLGMPPGRYILAGREYISDGTCGRLPDGTLSGSLLPLNRAIRNVVDLSGVDPAVAVQFCTLNSARALGLEATHGRVEIGRRADLALVDGSWEVLATIAGGALAFEAGKAEEVGSVA